MKKEISQLIDVYDVWYQPWWHSTWFYLFVLLGLVALIIGIVYFFKKRYQGLQILSLDDIAILHLQEAFDQHYETDDAIRDGYFKITMIVKVYLSKQYEIPLLGKTDTEIVESIKTIVPVDVYAPLQELFDRAFQIKFAQAAVSEKMFCEDVTFLQQLIEQIKQHNKDTAMQNS